MSAILEIPITLAQSAFQSFIILVQLAGSNYYLRFDWNEQCQSYFLSISDSNNVPLLVGVAMVIDYALTLQYQISGLFPGIIMLYDTSNTGTECGFGDLGQRCKLLYQESQN